MLERKLSDRLALTGPQAPHAGVARAVSDAARDEPVVQLRALDLHGTLLLCASEVFPRSGGRLRRRETSARVARPRLLARARTENLKSRRAGDHLHVRRVSLAKPQHLRDLDVLERRRRALFARGPKRSFEPYRGGHDDALIEAVIVQLRRALHAECALPDHRSRLPGMRSRGPEPGVPDARIWIASPKCVG